MRDEDTVSLSDKIVSDLYVKIFKKKTEIFIFTNLLKETLEKIIV